MELEGGEPNTTRFPAKILEVFFSTAVCYHASLQNSSEGITEALKYENAYKHLFYNYGLDIITHSLINEYIINKWNFSMEQYAGLILSSSYMIMHSIGVACLLPVALTAPGFGQPVKLTILF